MAEPSTTRVTRRKAWRGIRTRLVAVLLIPTLAALGLGGLRMATAIRDSSDATRAASIASALPDSFRLALQLQVERDSGSSDKVSPKQLGVVRATTDAAVHAWRVRLQGIDASHDPKLKQDLASITGQLNSIAELRRELAAPGTRLLAQTEYTNTLNLLLGLAGRLPDLGSAHELYRQASALGEVRTAAEALADQRTLVTKALAEHEISQFDLTALATATESWHAASDFFYANTSPRTQAEFDTINSGSGDLLGSHAAMQSAVESVLSTGDPDTTHMNVPTWNAASGDFLAQMAGVISTAATDLAKAVDARKVSAQRDALVSAVTVLLVLFLALLATVIVARSILRPLNRLRDAALDIARHGLPDRVRELEESNEVGDLSVTPIHVGSQDEIAEVATAFDAVHTEAVRLAGEQTQMRANVNKMFVNLSRRSQSLVERQLRLIDELESGEQDPEHLANLFRLDHLATRMRRNDESLMVLAGGDTGQGARGPVPVLDVLRAASSEVEQFARVEIESGETAKFRGSVAGDLVHLLAELIENATNFSPPDTAVVVRSSRTSPVSPLVIEIRDLGIGMTPPELDAANEKLRSAGGLDADVARMMGLVVASRLADRHGLSVELRTNSPRGVVARVEVPTAVLVQPETRSALLDTVDPLGDLPGAPMAPSAPLAPLATLGVSPSLPQQLKLPEPVAEPVSPAAETEADPLSDPLSDPLAEPVSEVLDEPVSESVDEPAAEVLDEPVDEVLDEPVSESSDEPVSEPVSEVLDEPVDEPVAEPVVAAEASEPPVPSAPSVPAAVRPPEGYKPPTTPIASEPPAKSWFATTVPLRDPEELLNTYLTGRAEGVGGAIKNPLGSITKRNGSPIANGANGTLKPLNGFVSGAALSNATSLGGSPSSGSPADKAPADAPADAGSPADAAPAARVEQPVRPEEPPAAPPLTSSGLPTRVPRNNMPSEQKPFDAFGSSSAPTATPAAAARPEPEPEPVVEAPRGPVLDPLIAELAADVLSAPSAEEALAEEALAEEALADEALADQSGQNDDDTSIFATLQSEWFTRRTPLEARRAQPDAATDEAASGDAGWVSPGDEGWRRAAELAESVDGAAEAPVTPDGLPVRVPGRNLVPGSAAPAPAPAAVAAPVAAPVAQAPLAENVVPLPRLERRRTRGLSSFQQGVSRARTTDTPESAAEGISEEITVPSAYDASANRANEEHQ